jgi:hypothetical protein
MQQVRRQLITAAFYFLGQGIKAISSGVEYCGGVSWSPKKITQTWAIVIPVPKGIDVF